MNSIFTIPEENIICIYKEDSRGAVIATIRDAEAITGFLRPCSFFAPKCPRRTLALHYAAIAESADRLHDSFPCDTRCITVFLLVALPKLLHGGACFDFFQNTAVLRQHVFTLPFAASGGKRIGKDFSVNRHIHILQDM